MILKTIIPIMLLNILNRLQLKFTNQLMIKTPIISPELLLKIATRLQLKICNQLMIKTLEIMSPILLLKFRKRLQQKTPTRLPASLHLHLQLKSSS
jgi:hypothetical protein